MIVIAIVLDLNIRTRRRNTSCVYRFETNDNKRSSAMIPTTYHHIDMFPVYHSRSLREKKISSILIIYTMPAQDLSFPPLKRSRFFDFIPFLVLGLFCVLSIVGYVYFDRQNGQLAQTRLHHETQIRIDQIQERIDKDITVIRGLQGLYNASDVVSRDEFTAYLDSLQLSKNYPGIYSVIYGKKVATDSSYITTYIYPESTYISEIGSVISSDPVNAQAIQTAVGTKSMAVSEVTQLPNTQMNVVLLVLPVGEKKNEEGVIVLRVNIASFLSSLTVSDSVNDTFFYRVVNEKAAAQNQQIVTTVPTNYKKEMSLMQVFPIAIDGVTWNVEYYASNAFGLISTEHMTPLFMAEIIIALGVFFFLLLYQTTRVKEHAVKMAEGMVSDLRESESRFKAITESAKDAIVMMDSEARVVLWTEGEMMGKQFHQMLATMPEHQKTERLEFFGKTGQSDVVGKSIELPAKKKDGTIFTIELTVARTKLHNEWHAVGIMRDVTERLHQVKALAEQTKELERMNKLMVDRELKMIELKKQIKSSV